MKNTPETNTIDRAWRKGFREGIITATLTAIFATFAYDYVSDVADKIKDEQVTVEQANTKDKVQSNAASGNHIPSSGN